MRDLAAMGITAATVRRAVATGDVVMVSRGVYRRTGAPSVPHQDLAEVAVRIPDAVICLFSAADFHDLGLDKPEKVWTAMRNSQKPPRMEWPALRVVQWRSPDAFEIGIETHEICGVPVQITSAARTVVDMLKMSATLGEEAALDCMRAYFQQELGADELLGIADQLGLAKRLAPYLRAYAHIARPR